tara:strand:- start:305 stop:532 length:228 start_codon:yes stop_codon:yes gene_type:complete
MNYKTISGIVATGISIGALTFQAGRHTETINLLGVRVSHNEERTRELGHVLFDIHGKVCAIEKDIKHIVKKIDDD